MTKIVTTARALIVEDSKVLLVGTQDSIWHIPGGFLEPGEDLKTCAKREIYEETGYEIEVGDFVYCWEFYDKKWDTHKVDCCFSAVITKRPEGDNWQDLGHDKSIKGSKFFSLEEIKKSSNVFPIFLKDGEWLKQPSVGREIYKGFEK